MLVLVPIDFGRILRSLENEKATLSRMVTQTIPLHTLSILCLKLHLDCCKQLSFN